MSHKTLKFKAIDSSLLHDNESNLALPLPMFTTSDLTHYQTNYVMNQLPNLPLP